MSSREPEEQQPSRASSRSLKRRVVSGSAWNFGASGADRLFKTLRTIVLAHLLSPHDFGLFGIAVLVLQSLDELSQSGFETALIRKRGDLGEYLDVGWTVQVARGTLMAIVLVLAAHPVALLVKDPAATPLIRVLAIVAFLRGTRSIGLLSLQRAVEFGRLTLWTLLGSSADFVVSVVAALILRNAWALVWGVMAGNVTLAVSSYLFAPRKPRLTFSRSKFVELLVFARWVFATSVMTWLVKYGDQLLIGSLLGATSLGLYQVGYTIGRLAGGEIARVASLVGYPALSELQESRKALSAGLLLMLRLLLSITVPMAVGLAVLAPEIVRTVLGAQWVAAIPVVQLLMVWAVAQTLVTVVNRGLYVVGKPHLITWVRVVNCAGVVSILYWIILRWGIAGAAFWMSASALVIEFVPACVFAVRNELLRPHDLFAALSLPFGSASVMAAALALMLALRPWTALPQVLLLVLIGAVVYGLSFWLFDWLFGVGLGKALRKQIGARRTGVIHTGPTQ